MCLHWLWCTCCAEAFISVRTTRRWAFTGALPVGVTPSLTFATCAVACSADHVAKCWRGLLVTPRCTVGWFRLTASDGSQLSFEKAKAGTEKRKQHFWLELLSPGINEKKKFDHSSLESQHSLVNSADSKYCFHTDACCDAHYARVCFISPLTFMLFVKKKKKSFMSWKAMPKLFK